MQSSCRSPKVAVALSSDSEVHMSGSHSFVEDERTGDLNVFFVHRTADRLYQDVRKKVGGRRVFLRLIPPLTPSSFL